MSMKGDSCVGVTSNWDYEKAQANCSILGCAPRFLKRLLHLTPEKPQNISHQEPHSAHGQKTKFSLEE